MVTACSSNSAAILPLRRVVNGSSAEAVIVGSLRRDAGGLATLHRNLGVLHTQGYAVSWGTLLADVAGAVVALPTYAFQRQRYWLEPARSLADVAAAGLSPSPHPLLGAATTLANQDGVLFTTRLSLADHPWLADHTVFGNVLLPGTAVLELALAAAQAVGGCTVAELMQSAPLVLTLQGAVRLQLFAGEPDGTGARAFALYSRDDAAAEDAPWTCHATGLLGAGKDPGVAADSGVALEEWPPAGAAAVDLTEFYPKLASQGFGYGPAFQGLVEAWRKGSTLYGRAVLPERIAATAGDYGIHPALLDAGLHLLATAWFGNEEAGRGEVLLPFAWSDVALQATGASELRICMTLDTTDGAEAIATLRPVRREPTAGGKGRRASPPSGDGRAGAAGFAVGGSRSLPYRLAGRGPGRWRGSELTVGGIGDRGSCAGARDRGLRDGLGALCCARWWSGGPGAGNRRCAERGRWSRRVAWCGAGCDGAWARGSAGTAVRAASGDCACGVRDALGGGDGSRRPGDGSCACSAVGPRAQCAQRAPRPQAAVGGRRRGRRNHAGGVGGVGIGIG